MRTRNLTGFAALFFAVTMAASAGDAFLFVEQQTRLSEEEGDQTQTVSWTQYDLTKIFGGFAWVQRVSKEGGYQQAYAGGSARVTDWCQVGIGAGVERGSDGPGGRVAGFALITRGKNFGFLIREDGATGPWNYGMYNRSIRNGRYGVGVLHQSSLGPGPRAEINLGSKKRIKLWTSVHKQSVQFGLRWTYASE